MAKYAMINFLHDYQDETLAAIMRDMSDITSPINEVDLFNYLVQWDYGEYSSIMEREPWGKADKVYFHNGYVLYYNYGLGYAGLDKIMEGGQE